MSVYILEKDVKKQENLLLFCEEGITVVMIHETLSITSNDLKLWLK